jgi:hypothetical protein
MLPQKVIWSTTKGKGKGKGKGEEKESKEKTRETILLKEAELVRCLKASVFLSLRMTVAIPKENHSRQKRGDHPRAGVLCPPMVKTKLS